MTGEAENRFKTQQYVSVYLFCSIKILLKLYLFQKDGAGIMLD